MSARRRKLLFIAGGFALLAAAGLTWFESIIQADLSLAVHRLQLLDGGFQHTFLDSDGRIFDRHQLHRAVYHNCALAEVDAGFVKALLSVEDENFYRHGGVDYLATTAAAGNYLLHLLGISEGRRGGGSTISQQLTKFLLGNEQRTLTNKVIELFVSLRLEAKLHGQLGSRRAAKESILSAYLNAVPVSNRIHGIKNALYLFGNHRLGKGRVLTANDKVLLLSAIYAPGLLNSGDAGDRRRVFERSLHRLRHKGIDIGINLSSLKVAHGWQKRREALRKQGSPQAKTALARSIMQLQRPSDQLPSQVKTARNSPLDKVLNARFRRYLRYKSKKAKKKCSITGAYLLAELQTGQVISAGQDNCDEFNELVAGRRQITSTIKPIFVALAMDDMQLTPASIHEDKRETFIDKLGEPYAPGNHYKIFKGNLTLKSTLEFSTNTIILKLLQRYGVDRFADFIAHYFAARPGEDLSSRIYADISLGLGTAEFSVTHVANAYYSLLSGGQKRYLSFSRRLSYPPSRTPSLSQQRSMQVRDMLTSVIKRTGSRGGYFSEHPDLILRYLGGKSGTNAVDSWFAGFSEDLLLVVWVGVSWGRLKDKPHFSAVELWPAMFKETYGTYPPRPLQHPEDLSRRYFCKYSGQAATRGCKRIQSGLFTPGSFNPQPCKTHPGTPLQQN